MEEFLNNSENISPEYKEIIQSKTDDFSNQVKGKALLQAYIDGASHFGDELSKRLKTEMLEGEPNIKAGVLEALKILEEYGC